MLAAPALPLLRARSLGERFTARETDGFDYLRIGLALAVLLWHNFNIAFGLGAVEAFATSPATVFVRLILPLFFALSGFLVASSLERAPSLDIFLWHRAVRLFPALAVEITLSALFLGPLLTTLTLQAYFGHDEFRLYLLNAFGLVNFYLPGVFADNIYPRIVNGSLWTIPYELECYMALGVLALVGLTRGVRPLLLITLALSLWSTWTYADVQLGFVVPGRRLVIDFLAGVLVFKLRDRLPGGLAAGLLSLGAATLLLSHPLTASLSSLPAAYAVAALGCTRAPRPRLLASGDYSYGIYLYAFPIQQTVVHLIGEGKPVLTLLLSLMSVSAFAAFSWHVVEKRMLRFKSLLDREPRSPKPV